MGTKLVKRSNSNNIWDIVENGIDSKSIRILIDVCKGFLGPFGSLVDISTREIETRIMRMRADSLRCLFLQLSKGEIKIDDSLVESDDFLFCYFSTLKAVANSRRFEKIDILAELLRNGINGNIIIQKPESERVGVKKIVYGWNDWE